MIKHIWIDFSDTIAFINKKEHDALVYETYAAVTNRPLTQELIREYENLYKQYHKSNSAVFRSLGLPSNFWSDTINSVDPSKFYVLADKNIPEIIWQLRKSIPVSIFSNLRLENTLQQLGINPEWFTHILSSDQIKEPKPALDGFYKMVELSNVPANHILYVGDDIGKDIKPAKAVGIKAGLMWDESSEADYCFKKFEDILNVLP